MKSFSLEDHELSDLYNLAIWESQFNLNHEFGR